MSSSKVYSQFSWAEQAHPIGSDAFVEDFFREREEHSTEGQHLKLLEQQHQAEVRQAFQNGFAQGEATGLERGLSETRRVEGQLAAAISALLNYRKDVHEQAKGQMLELAFAIADKVTSARAVAEKDTVIETINRCIAEILDKTRIKIKVSSEQYEFVKQRLDDLIKANDSIVAAVVEADSRVSAGGCIIETDSGSADARLESQLRLLRDKLIALES
jgi:flagellar assembly protein FliH